MIWYCTSSGQADPRPPPTRPIVGAFFSIIGDDLVFTAEMTTDQIKDIWPRSPRFNQAQITQWKVG